MLGMTPTPVSGGRIEILCIGAHCDDIEIGCGGTIQLLQRHYPYCRIHYLVLTSDPARLREAESAASWFIRPERRGEIRICGFKDGYLPANFGEVKSAFEDLRKAIEPHLVLTHHGADRHQDHRLVSEVTWQTFRDHMIWEYEIPKYDGDLTTPNVYVPVTPGIARRKVTAVTHIFKSQHGKSWFTADNLDAAMRIRGLECRAPGGFAEAFHCRKLVWQLVGKEQAPGTSRSTKVARVGRRRRSIS
jgi:LmbE family N-acetylglucosaminyl deacetylase